MGEKGNPILMNINVSFIGRAIPGQTVTITRGGESVTVRNPGEQPIIAPVAPPAPIEPDINVVVRNDMIDIPLVATEPAPAEPVKTKVTKPIEFEAAVAEEAEEIANEAKVEPKQVSAKKTLLTLAEFAQEQGGTDDE